MDDFLFDIGQSLLKLLPLSPFTEHIERLSEVPILGYINYFVPFYLMVPIGLSWLSAIGLFYIVSAALRWARMI